MTPDAFNAALAADAPPDDWPAPLKALWHSAKGDWDVGITIDIMESVKSCDRVYLLSGDGDFELLVAKLQNDYQVPVTVIATEKLTATNLIETADEFIAIDQQLLLAKKKY